VKKDTKSDILEAATKLFADSGFNGVSLRQISDEAKTSLNSIRNHFGSKEDLLKEMLDQMDESVYELPLRIIEVEATTTDEFGTKLELYFNEVLIQMITRKDVIKVALNDGYRVKTKISYIPQQKSIIKFIKCGQKSGIVSKDIDADMISGAFMDRLLPQVLHADHLKKMFGNDITNTKYRQKWVRATLNLFLYGLYTRN